MVFYSNFYFERLYVSKHFLIDGTYVFPRGFIQIIIFLYYEYITLIFIPAVFILINNKIQIFYQHACNNLNEFFLNHKQKN